MELFAFTRDDRDKLVRLVNQVEQLSQNTRSRDGGATDDHLPPEVYIAKTPPDGIPATTDPLNPGSADCLVYRVYGELSGTPEIGEIGGVLLTRKVYNLSSAALGGDSLIVIHRDKFGSWVAGGGSVESLAGTWALPVASVVQTPSLGGGCGTGSSGDWTGDDCVPPHTYAILQDYDPSCGTWSTTGCCYLIDINGRNPRLGLRYRATVEGAPPVAVTGATVPIELAGVCDFSAAMVYSTDVGDVKRTVIPETQIGTLCAGSAPTNLILYSGYSAYWDRTTCTYTVDEETVLIAQAHGCTLEIGELYGGDWDSMVKDVDWGGAAYGRTCTPLYLVHAKKQAPQGVSDVQCSGNLLRIYQWVANDDCGNATSTFWKTAGCCDCGEPPTEGGGTGTGATCCGRDLASTLYATVYGYEIIELRGTGATWDGQLALSCGETLYLRYFPTCALHYSCDGITYAPAVSTIGAETDCGPPFRSTGWQVNMANVLVGCAGACPTLDVDVTE